MIANIWPGVLCLKLSGYIYTSFDVWGRIQVTARFQSCCLQHSLFNFVERLVERLVFSRKIVLNSRRIALTSNFTNSLGLG
jgi:hypothetical protein